MRAIHMVAVQLMSAMVCGLSSASAQSPGDADVRVATLRYAAKGFDSKARIYVSREALTTRWNASSGVTHQPKAPPRAASEVAAVARAIGASVATATQDFSCVAESPTCRLPAPGTAVVQMSTPEVTDSTATVVVSLRSVPVASTQGPRRINGSVVWLRLVRRGGTWTVVEERPLSIG